MAIEAVNSQADALAALADGGFLRFYDGAQPATANGDPTNLLAELAFGSPAFAAAISGAITANPITPDSDAKATGTAAWFRVCAADGTPLWDGSVGTSGCDINLNSVSIQQHAQVSLTSFSHTVRS